MDELLDYSWDYEEKDDRIQKFQRGVCKIPLAINIMGDTKEDYISACNHFYDTVEYDVVNNKKGRLYYNGQYVECKLINNKKQDWCKGIHFHIKNISIVTDNPFWIKETEFRFYKQNQSELDSSELDYQFDYPHDYKAVRGTQYFMNDHYTASDFIMRIFGPCTNPSITITDHVYNVNVNISDGEYLEIDSRESNRNNSIILHGQYGDEESCFGKRNMYSSVFEKIPPGECTLTWPATYDIALTLLQERSEPKWT